LYTVHPSAQCWPVAVGPLSTLHLLRSIFRISWEPRDFCQTGPSYPIATPPEPGIRILSGGGTTTSALHVWRGFNPCSGRTRVAPCSPISQHHKQASLGLIASE